MGREVKTNLENNGVTQTVESRTAKTDRGRTDTKASALISTVKKLVSQRNLRRKSETVLMFACANKKDLTDYMIHRHILNKDTSTVRFQSYNMRKETERNY